MSKASKEYNEIRKKSHVVTGSLMYSIEVFGDHLAEKYEYKEHTGMDAILWYLIEKYKWLPSVAKSLNFEDLNFLLAEEMSGWTLPPDARV